MSEEAMHTLSKFTTTVALVAALALSFLPRAGVAQSMREVLGPGDTVRITAFRYPNLTTEARLSEDGKVTMPLLGEVMLQGLTPEQAARDIADRLENGNYLKDPQIGVAVIQARSRQVSVLGMVTHPGRYVLDGASARVTDVIALAGGLQPGAADTATVQRIRAGKAESLQVDLVAIMQDADPSTNVEIASGDSVFVPRAPVFYIYGEVKQGGAYRLEPQITVTQAIALAGGITPRGSEHRVQLRRRAPDGQWREWRAGLTDVVLAGDVIFVRESLF
jgi:polysaccharide export outer membrane protein